LFGNILIDLTITETLGGLIVYIIFIITFLVFTITYFLAIIGFIRYLNKKKMHYIFDIGKNFKKIFKDKFLNCLIYFIGYLFLYMLIFFMIIVIFALNQTFVNIIIILFAYVLIYGILHIFSKSI
jgi:hypothetical protein